MTNFGISTLTIDMYDSMISLWQRCEGVGLSNADSRENIASYLRRNPGMSLGAWLGETLVGTVLGGHDGRRGFIHHLAVDPGCRRCGIGTQLLTHCLAKIKEAGIQKCHLLIFQKNRSGIAFWQANGWTLREDIFVMSKQNS